MGAEKIDRIIFSFATVHARRCSCMETRRCVCFTCVFSASLLGVVSRVFAADNYGKMDLFDPNRASVSDEASFNGPLLPRHHLERFRFLCKLARNDFSFVGLQEDLKIPPRTMETRVKNYCYSIAARITRTIKIMLPLGDVLLFRALYSSLNSSCLAGQCFRDVLVRFRSSNGLGRGRYR